MITSSPNLKPSQTSNNNNPTSPKSNDKATEGTESYFQATQPKSNSSINPVKSGSSTTTLGMFKAVALACMASGAGAQSIGRESNEMLNTGNLLTPDTEHILSTICGYDDSLTTFNKPKDVIHLGGKFLPPECEDDITSGECKIYTNKIQKFWSNYEHKGKPSGMRKIMNERWGIVATKVNGQFKKTIAALGSENVNPDLENSIGQIFENILMVHQLIIFNELSMQFGGGNCGEFSHLAACQILLKCMEDPKFDNKVTKIFRVNLKKVPLETSAVGSHQFIVFNNPSLEEGVFKDDELRTQLKKLELGPICDKWNDYYHSGEEQPFTQTDSRILGLYNSDSWWGEGELTRIAKISEIETNIILTLERIPPEVKDSVRTLLSDALTQVKTSLINTPSILSNNKDEI